MTITLNQERNSSFLSSLILFIATLSLLFMFLYLGKKHYQQSKDESENHELPKEVFEPLPDNELPLPINKKEREKIWELPFQEKYKRLAAQRKWKSEVLPLLSNKESKKEIDNFLDTFYSQFLRTELNDYERKWREETKFIRPKKVDGRVTTKETLTSDIEKCKKIFPETEKAGLRWEKFGGWLTESEKGEKEKDNTVLMGLCVNEGGWRAGREKSWGKETVCYWTYRRTSIKLKPELFYFRYDTWVNIEPGKPPQIKIGWDELIATIAHELAHAVINTILIDDKTAKLDKGGHGNLHDDITERIQQMINRSSLSIDFYRYLNNLNQK